MRALRALCCSLAVLLVAVPASADITAFLGSTTTPSNRQLRGFAIGAGLLIVGFEFEFASTAEDPVADAPGLRTGMGNVLLQTPGPIAGIQPYLTTGGGVYRERLGSASETNIGINNGGGAKISVIGPLRVRVDYRVFTLRGAPREKVAHRFYVGANLAF